MHRPHRRFAVSSILLGFLASAPAAAACDSLVVSKAHEESTTSSDIFLYDSDGTNERTLVQSDDPESRPKFSPDRSKVVFRREPMGSLQPDLWVVNVDGTDLTNITNTPLQYEGDYNWSPDGSKVIYDADTPTKGVWVANADGSGKTRVAAINDPVNQVWSQDGSRISYQDQNRYLWVADADGQNASKIWEGEEGMTIGSEALWSPDSSKLVFVYPNADGVPKLRIINADGSGMRILTSLPSDASEMSPMWASNGRLYFHVNYGGEDPEPSDVYSVAANGGDARNLTADIDEYTSGPLRESPTRHGLLFQRGGQLWQMGLDGGSPTLVAAEPGAYDW